MPSGTRLPRSSVRSPSDAARRHSGTVTVLSAGSMCTAVPSHDGSAANRAARASSSSAVAAPNAPGRSRCGTFGNTFTRPRLLTTARVSLSSAAGGWARRTSRIFAGN